MVTSFNKNPVTLKKSACQKTDTATSLLKLSAPIWRQWKNNVLKGSTHLDPSSVLCNWGSHARICQSWRTRRTWLSLLPDYSPWRNSPLDIVRGVACLVEESGKEWFKVNSLDFNVNFELNIVPGFFHLRSMRYEIWNIDGVQHIICLWIKTLYMHK